MNRTGLGMCCLCLAAINLNCGGASEGAADDLSDKVAVISGKTSENGATTVVRTYHSRKEIAEVVRLKGEYARLKAEGVQPIFRDFDCNWNDTWLFNSTYLDGDLCCINGGGSASTDSLCGTGYTARSLYSGDLPGNYWRVGGPPLFVMQCFPVSFGSNTQVQTLSCDPSNKISLTE